MRIRPYLNKDFDIISQWISDERSHALWCANLIPYPLEKKCFDDLLLQAEERFEDSPFVATTDEGRVVGFFCFSVNLNTNEGMLKFVIIDDTMRNKGYGCEMLKLAMKYAFEIAKADAVQLNVFPENPGAKKCYQKVGFKERTLTENAFTFKNESWDRCNMIITNKKCEIIKLFYGGCMNNIFVNTRSSIKITGTKTIYFDPLEIEGTPHDADLVFITHEHYDHFSPEDIRKVVKKDTKLIVPISMLEVVKENDFSFQSIHGILPLQIENYEGVKCQAIPAYNINKLFHPKRNNWLGYLVELDNQTYYAMGDTDDISEARNVEADVVFIPIGGKYTMDAMEAAEFVNDTQPALAVPIHYGETEVAEKFVKSLKSNIKVQCFW